MSRLIEALRRAEEEKLKDEQKQNSLKGGSSDLDSTEQPALELSRADDSNEEISSQLDTSQHIEPGGKPSIDFELEPTESVSMSVSDEDATAEAAFDIDQNTANRETVIDTGTEAAETDQETAHFSRRKSDLRLDVATPQEVETKRRSSKLLWFILIVMLLLVAAFAYYYFFLNGDQNEYPTNTGYSQNRGFLVDLAEKEHASDKPVLAPKPRLERVIPEPDDRTLLENVQSITGLLNENTSEAMTALGDLLDLQQEKLGQNEIESKDNRATPVFQISRPTSIKGIESSLNYAKDNAQGGEYGAAKMEYQALLQNQPNNTDALIGLAKLEAREGNKHAAREYYLKLAQINPKDPSAQLGVLENSPQPSAFSFEAELKTLMSTYPEHSAIAFSLGKFYAAQKRWNEAREAFAMALQSTHRNTSAAVNPDYAFNLAVALEHTQQPKHALEKYLEAKDLSQFSPPGFDMQTLEKRVAHLEGL